MYDDLVCKYTVSSLKKETNKYVLVRLEIIPRLEVRGKVEGFFHGADRDVISTRETNVGCFNCWHLGC